MKILNDGTVMASRLQTKFLFFKTSFRQGAMHLRFIYSLMHKSFWPNGHLLSVAEAGLTSAKRGSLNNSSSSLGYSMGHFSIYELITQNSIPIPFLSKILILKFSQACASLCTFRLDNVCGNVSHCWQRYLLQWTFEEKIASSRLMSYFCSAMILVQSLSASQAFTCLDRISQAL